MGVGGGGGDGYFPLPLEHGCVFSAGEDGAIPHIETLVCTLVVEDAAHQL